MFRHLDLFSGIGGFALAASMVWKRKHKIHSFVEIDPFAQKVLKKHWPEVPIHEDIKTYKHDGTAIDILTGGFPCQDLSSNGHQQGIEGKRSGLWSEMVAIIGNVRPSFCVIENVPNLLTGGGGIGLEDYSLIWPKSGTMQNGKLYRRKALGLRTCEKGFLLWPTPQASDGQRLRFTIQQHRNTKGFQGNIVVQAIKRLGGYPKPTLPQKLMGYPTGWTSLEDTEMP